MNYKNKNLAINNGIPVIKKQFKKYNSIGNEELQAAHKVIKSGVLSDYIAHDGPNFLGGKYVKKFERYCEKYFDVKHAITVNSWTSGLIAAVGALNTEPGDEIILPTWTMSATAASILHYNAIPVFVDIEEDTFNIDFKEIEKKISSKTRAIITVDLFGHPSNYKELNKIAKKYKIKIISDSAQSIASKYKGKYCATIGDIGGISLNGHKHIQTGEGGVLFTNDDKIAHKLRLIRNHGEQVFNPQNKKKLINIIGFNFRMGEIEAAIGIEQLKKLKKIIKKNRESVKRLSKGLSSLKGLHLPITNSFCTHSYYVFAMKIDQKITGVHRDKIHKALVAEGLRIAKNYQSLHLLHVFKNKIGFGSHSFPWSLSKNKKSDFITRFKTANELTKNKYLGIGMCLFEYKKNEIDLIIKVFKKVWKNLDHL